MFGTEIPPFFFFSGNIMFVIFSGVMAPTQENPEEGTEEKLRLVKTITPICPCIGLHTCIHIHAILIQGGN